MTINLMICGASELVSFVNRFQPDVVVSFENPDSRARFRGATPRLGHVMGNEIWAARQRIIAAWDVNGLTATAKLGLNPLCIAKPPSRRQIAEAIAHFEMLTTPEAPVTVVVNCKAGISRSTALGLVLLRHRLGPGSEDECIKRLLLVQPDAAPNRAIIRHGDALMKCGGALVRAVENNRLLKANQMHVARSQRHALLRALRKA